MSTDVSAGAVLALPGQSGQEEVDLLGRGRGRIECAMGAGWGRSPGPAGAGG